MFGRMTTWDGRLPRISTIHPRDSRSAACKRGSHNSSRPRLLFDGPPCNLIAELALVLREHIRRDNKCVAPPNTTAVHMRLGDKPDILHPVRKPSQQGFGLLSPLAQQIASVNCNQGSMAVSLVGVINFSPVLGCAGDCLYQYSVPQEAMSASYVAELTRALTLCGVDWRWHTSSHSGAAAIDDDICFLATASHTLPTTGTLSLTLPYLRAALKRIMLGRSAAHAASAACRAVGPLGLSQAGLRLHSLQAGTCEHAQAQCVANLRPMHTKLKWSPTNLGLQRTPDTLIDWAQLGLRPSPTGSSSTSRKRDT